MVVEGIAILDDQSSHTYVYPNIMEDLRITEDDTTPSELITTTIQGTSMPERCHIISGLVVSSLDDDNEISLPPTYTNSKSLPNVIKEIPSPEDISSIPGVSHLADKFPEKQDWPTILLIGRDCMLAQTQEDLTWSDDQSQVAAKTPLGWVLIGSPATFKPNPKTSHSQPQNFLPTSHYKTILQRPNPPATNTNSLQTSHKTIKTKSFEQRQLEYYRIRAKIFGTKNSPYNIRPP